MEQEQNIGYLIVNVSTANGAIPLENASVTVFDADTNGNPPVSILSTDRSGKTPKISLRAPNRALSLQPGNFKPYATYLIIIEKEGYYTITDSQVPVFSGITSIQPAEMLPLAAENSRDVYPKSGLDITEDIDPQLGGE